ncbi:hypothetical protein, partial [Acinetobacter sp. YH01022]|uniref:hypothetical protein n=1 Tax=Acinetobacter sp. YH01022 TaxID=2601036 RepID=UPI001C556200
MKYFKVSNLQTLMLLMIRIFGLESEELINKNSRQKKSPCFMQGLFKNNELAMTYSHMGNPTLPSALRGFTSEFG